MASTRPLCCLLLLLLQTNWSDARPSTTRLTQILSGTSEKAKLRQLGPLADDPKKRNELLDDLCQAALLIEQKAVDTDASELPASTLLLLDLLGSSIEKPATKTLIELLQSKHTKTAMASAEALGRHNRKSALNALIHQTSREEYKTSYAFRYSTLKSIAQIRSFEAVLFLSVTLLELDGQLKHEVITFLEEVDASYFRGDQEAFAEWQTKTWQPLQESGFTNTRPGSPERYRAEQYRRASYYGMPIYAPTSYLHH